MRNLRGVVHQNIQNADWMDAATKQSAMLKLSKMGEKIGYPTYISNETKLMEDAQGVGREREKERV